MTGISTAEAPPLANRIAVLVLQHPQEQKQDLATAPLLIASLAQARRRIGLSWPSLAVAWGKPGQGERAPEASRWAVLYLGARAEQPPRDAPVLQVLDRKGTLLPDQTVARHGIEGLIVLDGTWAQAKTMWWRNAWLLKLRRIVLNPRQPSRYGAHRREPRAGALSTLEAAALALSELQGAPVLQQELLARFDTFLATLPPPPKPDYRRRRSPSSSARRAR